MNRTLFKAGFGIVLLAISFLLDKPVHAFILFIQYPLFLTFFKGVSVLTNFIAIFIFSTTVFLFLKKYKEWKTFSIGFLLAVVLGYLLKFLVHRERPLGGFEATASFSFPSGHATALFAAYPFVQRSFPLFKILFILILILGSFGRLYLGMHYLSDIITGALLGYFISETSLKLVKSS